MNLGALIELTRDLPCFDLALLVQAFGGPRDGIRVQLSRWRKQGKVVGLRRGLYALADPYGRAAPDPPTLAGLLYRPSYLSGLWALGFHGMIPERVVWLTSATPRAPRTFTNPFGRFEYRHLKQEAFFGYRAYRRGDREFPAAEPEKALLDHWHLTPGEWIEARLAEMRYQEHGRVDRDRLLEYAARFRSPRLERAAGRWLKLAGEEERGTVML